MPTLGWDRAYRSGDLVRHDPEGLVFVGPRRRPGQARRTADRARRGRRRPAGAARRRRPRRPPCRRRRRGNQVLVGYVVPADAGFDRAGRDAPAPRGRCRPRSSRCSPSSTTSRPARPARSTARRCPGRCDGDREPTPPRELYGHRGVARRAVDRGARRAAIRAPTTTSSSSAAAAWPPRSWCRRCASATRASTVADVYDYPRLGALADRLDDRSASGDGPEDREWSRPTPRRTQLLQTAARRSRCQTVVGAALARLAGSRSNNLLARTGCGPVGRARVVVVGRRPAGSLLDHARSAAWRSRWSARALLLRGVRPGTYPRGGQRARAALGRRAAGRRRRRGEPRRRAVDRLRTPGPSGATIGRGVDLHSAAAGHRPADARRRRVDRARGRPVRLLARRRPCSALGRVHDRRGRHRRLPQHPAARRAGRRRTPRSRRARPSSARSRRASAGRVRPPPRRASHGAAGRTTRPPRAPRWVVALRRSPSAVLGAAPGRWRRSRRALVLGRAVRRRRRRSATPPSPRSLAVPLATLGRVRHAGAAHRSSACGCSASASATGTIPVRSRIGWQVWATERLLDSARTLLFPLYASLLTPVWLRALGADGRRGRRGVDRAAAARR